MSLLIYVTEKSPVYTTITNLGRQENQIQQEMVCPDFISLGFPFPHSVSLRNPKRYWTTLSIFHEDIPWATGETLSLFLPRPLFLCRPTCMGASCLIVGKCPFSLVRTALVRASGQACTARERAPGNTRKAWGSVARSNISTGAVRSWLGTGVLATNPVRFWEL